MERTLRTCAVCRTSYPFCPKCNEDKDKPLFYFTFCSENCKNIYDVTSKFESGQISDVDAKEKLSKLDLSKSEDFGTSYKASIKKINSIVIATEEITDVEDEATETKEETIEEEKSIKKPRSRKAKNVEE